jgi:hypothetical protein
MDMNINQYPRYCQNCSNNPANNPLASGICCCSLPDMERAGWTGSGTWYVTATPDHATIMTQTTGTSTNAVLIERESPQQHPQIVNSNGKGEKTL